MPLRDYFVPPISSRHSWEGFFGGWPAVMVQRPSIICRPNMWPSREFTLVNTSRPTTDYSRQTNRRMTSVGTTNTLTKFGCSTEAMAGNCSRP